MNGYRECLSCGRRYFATDDNGYCSTTCFSSKSTESERKPGKTLAWVSVTSIILFLFFVVESYTVNFFLMIHVPFFKNHGQSVFAESSYDGILYLHEQLQTTEDRELKAIILDTLGMCIHLDDYQWKDKLLKEIFFFNRDKNPVVRKAVVSIYENAGVVPSGITLFDELRDIETRSLVFPVMERAKNPKFVDTLQRWLSFEDPRITGNLVSPEIAFIPPSEDDWYKAVETARKLDHPAMKHALLLAWIAMKAPYPDVRIEAVRSFSTLMYRLKLTNSAFRSEASVYAGKALKVLKSIAAGKKDLALASEAQKVLAHRLKVKSGVEFEALDFFGE